MPLTIDLTGKRALVTGAGKGIGRAICLDLARAGADVFAVSRTSSDLESLADEIATLGSRCAQATLELRDRETAAKLAELAFAAYGRIDVLVNNAGVALVAPALHVMEDDWDNTFATNTTAAFFCAQVFGAKMLERGWGRIINITSVAARAGLVDHAAYCASKAALEAITKVLAVEWGPRGVTVNAVAPTVILTPMGERVWGDPAKGGPMLAKIPVGRFGRPPDVSALVAFLASDSASLINGETIVVDGGFSAQ